MKVRSSITAEGIALLRAMESHRPESERICYDPYARYFVSRWMWVAAGFFMKIGYADWRGPGVAGSLAARVRYIDDYLLSCIPSGLQQLVILGAGYDSRAYRFSELKSGVKVFEVDHPATQRVKLEKLKKIFGKAPGHVAYVPVDFDKETLGERLYASGYDSKLKTLFIWEGVTYYITAKAVDDTLAFVAHNSGPGSSIIFDYTYTSVINGTYKRGEVASMKRSSRFTGEGMVFGIEEGKIEEFLSRRGFGHIVNVTGDDLHRLYFKGINEKRKVAPVYSIVHATAMPR